MTGPVRNLLRARTGHGHARVTNVELFFDLVFVYAITQLSHSFLGALSLVGAGHVLLLFLAVWWAWIYTSWVTNWLDPERIAVRAMLLLLMLVGLVLSAAIPEAFEQHGLAFALAYVGIQLGRSVFAAWAVGPSSPANRRNFQRIAIWFAVSGVPWVAGALWEEFRLPLWIAAVAIEYAGPSLGFHVPGLGRSTTADWDVEGGHMAERCSLFIIIAFGESILATGATFGESAWDGPAVAAFVAAFVGNIVMWWIYFDTGVERGTARITGSEDPGRVARLAYTYLHLPIVGGLIVTAVANDLILAHPAEHEHGLVVLAGPLIYVAGNTLFKRATTGRWPLSHLVGLALFILPAVAIGTFPILALAGAVNAVLIVIAVWETISLRVRGAANAEALTPP